MAAACAAKSPSSLPPSPQPPASVGAADCQHLAANATVNLRVPAESLTVFGTLSAYTKAAESANSVTCQFCPNCGTQLFAQSAARPQWRVIRAGNLDEPSSIKPSMNIWADSAPAWACIDPSLDRVAKQPVPPAQVDGQPGTGLSKAR
ncbi:MAG: GFA family protein [Betaproteobacteria bacterium]